jgi:hypothetical protein
MNKSGFVHTLPSGRLKARPGGKSQQQQHLQHQGRDEHGEEKSAAKEHKQVEIQEVAERCGKERDLLL